MWDFRLPCLITWGDLILQHWGSWRDFQKKIIRNFVPPTYPQLQRLSISRQTIGDPKGIFNEWRLFSIGWDVPWQDHPHSSGKWSWNDSWVMFQPWFPASHFRCGRFQMLHCSFFFFPTGTKKFVFAIFTSWCLLVEFLLIPTRLTELVTWPGYWDAEIFHWPSQANVCRVFYLLGSCGNHVFPTNASELVKSQQ